MRSTALIAALLAASPCVCAAETLAEAISLAYQTNPSLRAQRAALQSADESYVQAQASFGPQVSVTAQYGYQDAQVQHPASLFVRGGATDYRAGNGTADLSAVQPVWTGGALKAQARSAGAGVLAAREHLRFTESQVLQNVVNAYIDVRRDREIVRVLQEEVTALSRDFEETRAKGKLGALTRTDVAQSEARLLSAQAQLSLAQGKLNGSNAEYLNAVGQNPGELAPEPDLPGLPKDADKAFDLAEHNNPQLGEAVQSERAAREKVNQAKAANAATVQLKFDASIIPTAPYLERQYDQSVSVAAVVTKPLFTSGLNSSKIRQALDDDNRAQLVVENARRGVVQLVAQAWDQWISTQNALTIEQRQLDAEAVAVQGNRAEERVGLRTTIDLLNAEQELANTRVTVIQAKRDAYAAKASLLAAMGVLEARYLTPGIDLYSPEQALRRSEPAGLGGWSGAVSGLDTIAAPRTPAPQVSPTGSGTGRPDTAVPTPAK
ncbi:TolC family outer membrane protein [Phenylobacterium montanum]|uniref:TolC family outer membrane protein n=1 Tax=Phenylobacterium montanum TaxID=2823693 RepID=A0A975IV76_9CAUL|nr:TolC family outer membrane protein [Caulobacter sp. S6]QUD88289.1 TolC family outer membrane protein [Caulobacter sp. S6]